MIPIRSIALAALLALSAGCGETDCCGEVEADTAPLPIPAETAGQADSASAWTMRFDGIGPLRVGMTLDEARAALGGDLRMSEQIVGTEEGPDRCDHPASARIPAGVLVMVEGRRVVRVEVDSGRIATAEGARIGDTEARIEQLYPGRVTVWPHKYTDGRYLYVRPAEASDTTRLLIFETDGRVVQRFRAGRKPQVEYVEGCA